MWRPPTGAARGARRSSSRDGVVFVVAVGWLLSSCGGEAGFSGPPPDDDGDELRPGLTVRVEVEEERAEIAEALGWTGGVPGAEVRIHRLGTDFAWETEETDASGVARFPDAIPGTYRVAGYRPLTSAEGSQAGEGVLALGDGVLQDVFESTESSLGLTPTVEGSVVFGEVYATAPTVAEVRYDFHMYFELYNTSEETVFLDGMLFGSNLGHNKNEDPGTPCSEGAQFRNDPTGVWAQFLHQFPGSGAEHPLAPGETAVVALDAVDHSQVDPRFPDLSNADFELLGSSDVDNPDVPNLPEVGVRPFPLGHGLRFFVAEILYLGARIDPSTLERAVQRTSGQDIELMKIPADAVVDVLWTDDDDALEEQQFEKCDPLVHPSFDRLGGGFIEHGADLEFSVQRLVIGEDGGREILQDTNVSAVDLIRARFSPGSLPQQ